MKPPGHEKNKNNWNKIKNKNKSHRIKNKKPIGTIADDKTSHFAIRKFKRITLPLLWNTNPLEQIISKQK